jgi:hypothetical protein
MATIAIEPLQNDVWRVRVEEAGSATTHDVTVTPADAERYAPGVPVERLLEASFAFLLEREPKESILSSFALPVIERYFPEYPTRIAEALRGAPPAG